MTKSSKDIWFPAKRYGWGWGLPVTWQGWLVFAGYFALFIWGALVLRERLSLFEFTIYVPFITSILVLVCWVKGEKPHWRWVD